MTRSLALLLLTAVSWLNAYAGESAQWTLKTEQVGSVVELSLTAKVSEPWHLCGRTGGGAGQSPLELNFKLPPGIEPSGDWIWPKPETIYEGRPIEIYTGTQTFTRKLKVTTATGEVRIRVTVSYQACTHEVCGPPEEEELTATLKIAESRPDVARQREDGRTKGAAPKQSEGVTDAGASRAQKEQKKP